MTAAAAMAGSGTKYPKELEEGFLESGKPERKCRDLAGLVESHSSIPEGNAASWQESEEPWLPRYKTEWGANIDCEERKRNFLQSIFLPLNKEHTTVRKAATISYKFFSDGVLLKAEPFKTFSAYTKTYGFILESISSFCSC